MLEGVEILIARMETNPEEFVNGNWDYFLEDVVGFSEDLFNEDEVVALKEAKAKLSVFKKERARAMFTQRVIEKLMTGGESELRPELPTKDTRERLILSKVEAMRMQQRQKTFEEYAKKYKQEGAV